MPGLLQSLNLQSLNSSSNLAKWASGALVNMTRPVAAFIAPPVTVESITFPYKVWDFSNRMTVPNTERSLGGAANQLTPKLSENWVTIKARALEMVLAGIIVDGDFQAQIGSSEGQFEARQAMSLMTSAQGLATSNEVINTLVNNAGASVASLAFSAVSNVVSGQYVQPFPTYDPVDLINSYILPMIENTGTDRINVLFGATAWKKFCANGYVIDRKLDLTWENSPSLFCAQAKYLPSYEVATPGLGLSSSSAGFILPPDSIFIFPAIDDQENMSDPSFMRMFRTASSLQVRPDPEGVNMGGCRFYSSSDGRDIIAAIDYEQLPVVTAPGTAVRLTVS